MIKKILYHNFKCFNTAELTVENITTLIGTNSSGKTNAIEGMMILSELVTGIDLGTILDGTKNSSGVRGGAHGCSRFHGDNFTLGCIIGYDDVIDLKYEITVNVCGRAVVEAEHLSEITWKKDVPVEKMIFSSKPSSLDSGDIAITVNNGKQGRNPDISCLKNCSSISQVVSKLATDTKYGKTAVQYCKTIIEELRDVLYLSPEPSLMRGYSAIGDYDLKVNASNISSVLYNICNDEGKRSILMKVMRELPENEVADISFEKGSLNDVILFLDEKYGNGTHIEKTDATQLSDGTLRCLAIIAAFLSEKENGTIVIEEIDNGIHPGRTTMLLRELSQLAKKRNIDLIFSTHNPVLLNALTKEELLGVNVVYRSDDTGEGCMVSLSDIDDLPVLLARGKLGDVFINDSILKFIKTDTSVPDLSWLEA